MDIGAAGNAAALWAGLHLFLLLGLSMLVVRQRRLHKVALGDGGIPELVRAVRAFGNATEYVPTGLIAIAILAIVGASPLAIHIAGLTLFAGRVLHAIGLSQNSGATIVRSLGVVLTWVSYVFAGVALLFYAIL
jgi:uncharacterized protein